MTLTVTETRPTQASTRPLDDAVSDSLHDVDVTDLHDTVIAHRDRTWCTWPAAECPDDPFGSSCTVAAEVAELAVRDADL